MNQAARGSTSRQTTVFIQDSTSTVGAGKTGLTNVSANLKVAVRRELSSAWTVYSGANLLAVSTVGTWLDPGAGKARFGEEDATNAPGAYALQFENTPFAVGDGSRFLNGMITGDGIAPCPFKIDLEAVNAQDAIRAGMTALPNAAADAAGGLPISDAGGLDLDARLDAAVSSRLATAGYTAPDNAGIATAVAGIATLLGRITSSLFSGITSLGNWLRLMSRKTGGDATALSEINTSGGTYAEATDSLEGIRDTMAAAVDTQLSSVHGSGAWGSAGSSGARTITVTVRDSQTLANLPDALVTVRDSSNTTIVDQKRTTAAGTATFSLDDATYKVSVTAQPGYSSLASQSMVVDGNETVTYSLDPLASNTPSPGTRTVNVYAYGPTGAAVSGKSVSARIIADLSSIDSAVLLDTTTSGATDANGRVQLQLVTEDQFTNGDGYYEIKIEDAGTYRVQIPAGSGAVNLEDLL